MAATGPRATITSQKEKQKNEDEYNKVEARRSQRTRGLCKTDIWVTRGGKRKKGSWLVTVVVYFWR